MQCISEPGNPRLAVHTPHLTPAVVKLQFTSDTLLEEWQAQFSSVSSQMHSVVGMKFLLNLLTECRLNRN